MADISEVDVFEAFQSQWASSGVLVGWIPPGRLFHTTVWNEGVQYPICVITIRSSTRMLCDPYYLKHCIVKLDFRFKREEIQRSIILKEIRRLYTGSDASPTAGLQIDGATVLHSFPTDSEAKPQPKESEPGGPFRPTGDTLQYFEETFDVLIQVTRDT